MEQTTVFIALGSNLQDRLENLRTAISHLPPRILPVTCSSIYETAPWGYLDQPYFLNQVIQATTDLSPEELLVYLKGIEIRMGRQPGIKLGPRLIDLDILFYGDLVLNTLSLKVPHPFLHQRSFVLVPLAELAPEKLHPVLKISVKDLLAEVDIYDVEKVGDADC